VSEFEEESDYAEFIAAVWASMRQVYLPKFMRSARVAAKDPRRSIIIRIVPPLEGRWIDFLLRDDFDLGRFKRALAEVILRDPMLREHHVGKLDVQFREADEESPA
jgi:hypothetical protein